jgi:hypothetical protein
MIYTPRTIKNRLLWRYVNDRADNKIVEPPYLGEIVICLFVTPEKQVDRLADFEELFTLIWLPKFGTRIARLIYITHAIKSAGAIIRIGLTTAIVDRLLRALGS